MKGKVFFIIVISFLFTASLVVFSASTFKLGGFFNFQNGWSGVVSGPYVGYPGRVNFNAWSGVITSSGTLSWSFWLWNVGWATFSHGVPSQEVILVCPTTIWNDATQICPVTGSVWSQYAGWIVMGSTDLMASGGTYSGVYYNPNTSSMEGWWWSANLGWVPFWTWISSWTTLPDGTTIATPIAASPINFVSKIAIVGNIAGSRVYSVTNSGVTNQDVGYTYKTINHASILNMLRKNIAIMSRNIDPLILQLDSSTNPHNFILIDSTTTNLPSNDYVIHGGWSMPNSNPNKRSIIVIWWDIILDQTNISYDGTNTWDMPPIALIALKDASGNGWNIVISDSVKRIYAYLYSEWSILSGTKPLSTGPIDRYTDYWVWNIPQSQLYIRWLAASKNTIWGAQQKPTPICPVLTPLCNTLSAKGYDWDYFRTYDITDPLQDALVGTPRDWVPKLDEAVMIIEYDPRILIDPPPWFQEI